MIHESAGLEKTTAEKHKLCTVQYLFCLFLQIEKSSSETGLKWIKKLILVKQCKPVSNPQNLD
jgi:hypothetical protein